MTEITENLLASVGFYKPVGNIPYYCREVGSHVVDVSLLSDGGWRVTSNKHLTAVEAKSIQDIASFCHKTTGIDITCVMKKNSNRIWLESLDGRPLSVFNNKSAAAARRWAKKRGIFILDTPLATDRDVR